MKYYNHTSSSRMDDYFEKKRSSEKPKQEPKFISQLHNPENELSKHTVGLVQLEDFQRIKGDLQNNAIPTAKAYIYFFDIYV